MYNFTIASVFRNETPYLREWIEYHILLGCENFYLACNDDNYVNTKEQLQSIDAPFKSRIILFPWNDRENPQDSGLAYIFKTYGNGSKWMAFIDIDEFIFPVKHNSIPEFLEKYDSHWIAGLYIHWCVFGSSGKKRMDGNPPLVIENFFQRGKKNNRVNIRGKLIIRPEKTAEYGGSHYFKYKTPYYAVNEDFYPVPLGGIGRKSWRPTTVKSDKIRINHYAVKSKYDFKLKKQRGYVRPHLNDKFNWGRYKEEFDLNDVRDDTMKRFIPEVKERMQIQ